MHTYVTSADGTRIAYERFGEGSPLVIVGGLFCDRKTFQPLAEQLAPRFAAITYDRRGRGDSGNTLPYAVVREVQDLAAVIAAAGGVASVYGHSSGAGLALEAAAAGLPINRLLLHEPPYGGNDEESQREARELAETVRVAIAEDRRGDAIKAFLTASEMPPEMAEGASHDPKMLAIAPTMPYDFEVMGDSQGGTIPEERVRAVRVPTLVILGGASPEFFHETANRLVDLLPNGRLTVLEGQDHGAPPEVVAPVVAEFVGSAAVTA
jgi:pimeloyl-ACP methyl ester carboxylesterase